MLLRLTYLGVTNALALLRLLPMSDRDKDAEILALRHQIGVLERQLHGEKVRFTPTDRAWLAAQLHRLHRKLLHDIRLLAPLGVQLSPSLRTKPQVIRLRAVGAVILAQVG